MPGEEIEITAGLAFYSWNYAPQITIGGKKIENMESGKGAHTIKAPNQPGKHILPMMIEFTDDDGNKHAAKKQVKYTVSKCN